MISPRSKMIKKSFKILKKHPQSTVFAVVADVYRQNQQFKIAEKICLQGIRYHPRSCRGYSTLGRTYFDQGRYQEAQKAFEKALDLEPKNLLTLRFLGKIYIQLRNLEQALKIYKMIHLFYPNQEAHKNILEQLQTIATERYNHFSSKNLKQVAQELDQKELLQRPRIQPLNHHQKNHTVSTSEVLKDMNRPPQIPTSFPITIKEKKSRKIVALKNLMDRLTPPSSLNN